MILLLGFYLGRFTYVTPIKVSEIPVEASGTRIFGQVMGWRVSGMNFLLITVTAFGGNGLATAEFKSLVQTMMCEVSTGTKCFRLN